MNSTSEVISLLSPQNGGAGVIPDLGTGLSKQPSSVQWIICILIIVILLKKFY